MKKLISGTLVALFSATLCANAQSDEFAELPRTDVNHSVSINLIGLHYAYELPIGRKTTIIGRVGANVGMAWGSWRTGTGTDWAYSDFYWKASPVIEVEPRWYYGLDRRERHGRSADKNVGSFVSINVQNVFPGFVSDKDMRSIGATTFSPMWGLRRVWNDHWMLEFTTGIKIGVLHDGTWWGGDREIDHLDVNVRFGYSF